MLAAALSAVGIPARVLGLQRADVETARSGAGHVVAEAWLADRGKWIMVDGQWDVIPVRGQTPLNAVELQQALAARAGDLRVESLSGTSTWRYRRWIAPYLYHFLVTPRAWVTGAPAGDSGLMLLPIGVQPPQRFQRRWAQEPYRSTRSPAEFYAPPASDAWRDAG